LRPRGHLEITLQVFFLKIAAFSAVRWRRSVVVSGVGLDQRS